MGRSVHYLDNPLSANVQKLLTLHDKYYLHVTRHRYIMAKRQKQLREKIRTFQYTFSEMTTRTKTTTTETLQTLNGNSDGASSSDGGVRGVEVRTTQTTSMLLIRRTKSLESMPVFLLNEHYFQ